MFETLTWWLMLEIIGLAALPIIFFLARRLPGRGYALSKILGILLLGYVVWLAGSLRLLAFSAGSTYIVLLLIVAFSVWLLRRDAGALWQELRQFVRDNRTFIIVTEVLFALAFFGWAFYRAHDPQVMNTEKYMDFGFLNAILNSDYFPPQDQWLAGYSINYYYFGYLITAVLTKMSGVNSNITYNLANALYFALGMVGSFGILWELVSLRRRSAGQLATAGRQHSAPFFIGLLGALLIMAGGNLYTAKVLVTGQSSWEKIWNEPMYGNVGWDSSRVIVEKLNGQKVAVDPINEFPAFSYMLADLHPHVMALPLTMLALFFGLLLLVSGYGAKSLLSDDLHARLMLIISAIILGGLFMANTWDFPTYLLIATLALLVNSRRLAKGALRLVTAPVAPTEVPATAIRTRKAASEEAHDATAISNADVDAPAEVIEPLAEATPSWSERLNARPWASWLVQVVALAILSLILYLPYLLTYKAPFGASLPGEVTNDPTWGNIVKLPFVSTILRFVGPNVWDKSWEGFALMFALSLYASVIFLLAMLWKAYRTNDIKIGAYITAGIIVLALILAFLLKFPLLMLLPPMIAVSIYALSRLPRMSDADSFVTLIVGVGALIALGTELVFLRDVFDNRQNTIFKFYYQIWMIWNLAAAYAAWWLVSRALGWLRERRDEVGRPLLGVASLIWAGGFVVLLLASALYLPAAMREKSAFYGSLSANGQPPSNNVVTLDGWFHFGQSNPADYAAMNWLRQNTPPNAVIAEAKPDVEYQMQGDAGRVSTYTGRPAVLAWRGHEYQWHNGDSRVLDQLQVRTQDVINIFTGSADQAKQSVDKYAVQYIFVGSIEREVMRGFPGAEDKYTQLGYVQVYNSSGTTIYATPYAFGNGGPIVNRVAPRTNR